MPAALLLGVPTGFEDFVSRIEYSDWLSRFNPVDSDVNEERASGLKAQWDSEYLPLVAEPLADLVKEALALNVVVQERATLKTLFEITNSSDCVILFGHWKGHEILADDIVPPMDSRKFLSRAMLETTQLGCWLARELSILVQWEEGTYHRDSAWWKIQRSFRSVVEILREAVENPDISREDNVRNNVDRVLESAVSIRARRRQQVDRIFSGCLRPGNRLELFDGLHSKEDVEAAISDHFTGTLDLTTCTSTILGDYISAKRNRQLRTVQFDSPQEFAWQAQCVALALQIMTEQNLVYRNARMIAVRMLKEGSPSVVES